MTTIWYIGVRETTIAEEHSDVEKNKSSGFGMTPGKKTVKLLDKHSGIVDNGWQSEKGKLRIVTFGTTGGIPPYVRYGSRELDLCGGSMNGSGTVRSAFCKGPDVQ